MTPNKITVIVGLTGSSKSPLLETIGDLTNLYEDKITVDEKEYIKSPPHEIARLGIMYLF